MVPDGLDLVRAGRVAEAPSHPHQPSLQVDMEGNEQDQDQWMI